MTVRIRLTGPADAPTFADGFVRYGVAPAYLKIAGRWQDHVMFQVINSDGDGTAS